MREIYQSDKSLNNSYNSSLTFKHIKLNDNDVESKITLFKSDIPTQIFIIKVDSEEKVFMTIQIGNDTEKKIEIDSQAFLTFYSSLNTGPLLNIG